MEKKAIQLIIIIIVALLVVGGVFYFLWAMGNAPSKLNGFAQCIKAKGVIFYGAFWCPHCQAQKALFGSAAQYLPYVECSTPDGSGQLQVCTDKKITGYPTWVFPDGTTTQGDMTLQQLATKTGCELPK